MHLNGSITAPINAEFKEYWALNKMVKIRYTILYEVL